MVAGVRFQGLQGSQLPASQVSPPNRPGPTRPPSPREARLVFADVVGTTLATMTDFDGSVPAPDGLTAANDDDLNDDGAFSYAELASAAMAAGSADGEVTDDE